jgi:protein-tyrosine-phosphatase
MPNESNRSAETRTPLRILFLCTGNSARSQIAEALLTKKGGKHFVAGSAGVDPQPAVHPGAIKVLADYGIDWSGHTPKSVDQVGTEWDLIITVCDRAREIRPLLMMKRYDADVFRTPSLISAGALI